MSRLWLISYDIADDKIRRRVFQQLKNHGQAVQYSAFECRLSPAELNALRLRLIGLIDPGDSLRWYPLCTWCSEDVVFQGVGLPPQNEDYYL